MDLERLIEQARASGTLDSSGRFTLDLPRAWAKLGEYAAEGTWILCLVRAAVGLGAQRLEVAAALPGLSLTFVGCTVSPTELEHLFEHPFHPESPLGLQELSTGIFLALSRGVAGRARVRAERVSLEVGVRDARPYSRVTLVPARSPDLEVELASLGRLTGLSQAYRTREALVKSCRLSPIPIYWNRRPLPRGPKLSDASQWGRVVTSLQLPGTGLPEPVLAGFNPTNQVRLTDQPFDALLALVSRGGGLTVVVRGVAHELESALLPGARVWVANPTLRLDLAGRQILRDESFHQMVLALHGYLLEFACQHWEEASPELILLAVARLPDRAQALRLGLQVLSKWPARHPARAALLAQVLILSLSEPDLTSAELIFSQLQSWRRRPAAWLARLRRPTPTPAPSLEGLSEALLALPDAGLAVEWLGRLAGVASEWETPVARPRLVELALTGQRYALAARLSLELLRPMLVERGLFAPARPLRANQALSLGRWQLESHPELAPEFLRLVRALGVTGRTRLAESLPARVEPELRARAFEQAAEDLRRAAQRYHEQRLRLMHLGQAGFRWRSQYLKRADELYASALECGHSDPLRVRLQRARGAGLPIEGLARGGRGSKGLLVRQAELCWQLLDGLGDLPEARLFEAELRLEVGDYARAQELLVGAWPDPWLQLQAEADLLVLGLVCRRTHEFSTSDFVQRAELALGVSAAATLKQTFEQASRLPCLPEALGPRLIRLSEHLSDWRAESVLRCALVAQFRSLGQDELEWQSLPAAALRLRDLGELA